MNVRHESSADFAAIRRVHSAAFGGPSEANLVEALREGGALTISLVAEEGATIVGHIAFSPVKIGEHGTATALALAPVAVVPDQQRKGIGSRLIKNGLAEAQRLGWEIVIVLGHHDYYPRFSFVPAKPHGILSPFDVPDEAFMVMELSPHTLARYQGVVSYHQAFGSL